MSSWSRQAIQCFGKDDGELARGGILQELLYAGPDQAGPGDGLIDVGLNDRPSFLRGALLAQAQLVLDRGLALQVRAVAGIDGRAW
jgi:hypothetical protein